MNVIRKFIYNFLFKFEAMLFIKKPLVVVLCYHNIGNDSWKFSISKSAFKRQINYLTKDREAISLSELYSYLAGERVINKPSFVLTFDDGCKGVLDIVEFLKLKKITPTIFIIADTEKANRQELDNNLKILNKKDILRLYKYGWQIGCHSMTHADFSRIDLRTDEEILKSKIKMESDLDILIEFFSFPKGRYSENILSEVHNAKYKMAVTMDDGFINRNTNLYKIPRVGVDKTHSFNEFKSTISAGPILFRSLIKKTFLFKYI